MHSIDLVLKKYEGVGPGFDLVRISLAGFILCTHCIWLAGRSPILAGIGPTGDPNVSSVIVSPPISIYVARDLFAHINRAMVPMFFALSGFLVTGSAFRTRSLRTFLTFRVLRIAPALFVEVTLSALVLGPLLTNYPLDQYFSDPRFLKYFGNIVGSIHFQLPGLFVNNKETAIVNMNLWTLPGEFYCYLIVAGLLLTSILYSRKTITILFVAVSSVLVPASFYFSFGSAWLHTFEIVYYFFCGVIIFHWKAYIPCHPVFFASAGIITYGLFSLHAYYVAPIFLSYFVIVLGMIKFPRVPLIQSGDYSYGVYLYGFPITQAILAVVPWFQEGHRWWLIVTSIPLTFIFAVGSWHIVEKRVLRLKRYFLFFGKKQTA